MLIRLENFLFTYGSWEMLILEVFCNVDQSKLTPQLSAKAVDVVANALGKPKNYVCALFVHSVMNFGGDSGPSAIVHLSSIGKIAGETNKKTKAKVTDLLVKELGVDEKRLYINFHNFDKSNVGYMRTIFADLM
ncbi:macrophage migration inhibitory factor-like [Brevipalpus obovatus]|uniref:macrophage migration inhibitory factor-like n=1 Tax=Brevipalpus obovatus TaxID=246614 RepID=UPI003D9F0E7F